MKKIIYLLTIVGLLFTGCDPIEDINNEIDGRDNPIVGSADYTLTDEDYEELELGFVVLVLLMMLKQCCHLF